ncbi:hypothetical protein [Arhodomonas sp. AD133]|uniref:hypothetical protein n=1 Tax=Arhodomonas sp. AD133 TaxID=3415009 RepID=UPI003EB6BBB0
MRRRISWFLALGLLGSVVANAYLFGRISQWQEAWTQQILATSTVERLYMESEANVSYESVKTIVERKFGDYEALPAQETGDAWLGSHGRVLVVDGTKLLFKEGRYIGSKANLPEGLAHWGIGEPF